MKHASFGVALVCLFAGSAEAQTPAVSDPTGGTPFNEYYAQSTGDVVGFRFVVDQAMAVSALGAWSSDTVPGFEGLTVSHQVGLWLDSSQTLLASATVTPTSTLIGAFRYEDLTTPLLLTPGVNYTVGMLDASGNNDAYLSGASFTPAPGVTVVGGVYPASANLGFVYPTNTSGSGRFGPNLLLTPIPEPTTAGLLALGGVALLRRRRSNGG